MDLGWTVPQVFPARHGGTPPVIQLLDEDFHGFSLPSSDKGVPPLWKPPWMISAFLLRSSTPTLVAELPGCWFQIFTQSSSKQNSDWNGKMFIFKLATFTPLTSMFTRKKNMKMIETSAVFVMKLCPNRHSIFQCPCHFSWHVSIFFTRKPPPWPGANVRGPLAVGTGSPTIA